MGLHREGKIIERADIEIHRGIFQGDSLTPLLFCISLIRPPQQLYKLNTGYEEDTTTKKVSHVFYMNDLKLRGKTMEEIQKEL
jgi:hypothetical protein